MSVTVNDLISRWRPLTNEEIEKAETFITDVENALHVYAYNRGLDLDEILEEYEPRQGLYIAVVCDIVRREMIADTDESPALSQSSLGVNGYSISGTYLSPGGGLFVKNSELKMLGIPVKKQKARSVELYDYQGDTDNTI